MCTSKVDQTNNLEISDDSDQINVIYKTYQSVWNQRIESTVQCGFTFNIQYMNKSFVASDLFWVPQNIVCVLEEYRQ